MASVAVSNITNVIPALTNRKGTAMNIGGCPVAVFRIASGQAPADTAALSSAEIPIIQSVFGPVTHNLPATGASSVTVTLGTFGGTAATIGLVEVWLVGPVGS
jgi:hypothetical protein